MTPSGSVTYAYFTGSDGDITGPNNQMVYSIMSNVQADLADLFKIESGKLVYSSPFDFCHLNKRNRN